MSWWHLRQIPYKSIHSGNIDKSVSVISRHAHTHTLTLTYDCVRVCACSVGYFRRIAAPWFKIVYALLSFVLVKWIKYFMSLSIAHFEHIYIFMLFVWLTNWHNLVKIHTHSPSPTIRQCCPPYMELSYRHIRAKIHCGTHTQNPKWVDPIDFY